MKNKKLFKLPPPPDQIIGQFGGVKLLQTVNGTHYMSGGSKMERTIVKNWCQRLAPFLDFSKTKSEQQVLTE